MSSQSYKERKKNQVQPQHYPCKKQETFSPKVPTRSLFSVLSFNLNRSEQTAADSQNVGMAPGMVIQRLMTREEFINSTKSTFHKRGVHNGELYKAIEPALDQYHGDSTSEEDKRRILLNLHDVIRTWLLGPGLTSRRREAVQRLFDEVNQELRQNIAGPIQGQLTPHAMTGLIAERIGRDADSVVSEENRERFGELGPILSFIRDSYEHFYLYIGESKSIVNEGVPEVHVQQNGGFSSPRNPNLQSLMWLAAHQSQMVHEFTHSRNVEQNLSARFRENFRFMDWKREDLLTYLDDGKGGNINTAKASFDVNDITSDPIAGLNIVSLLGDYFRFVRDNPERYVNALEIGESILSFISGLVGQIGNKYEKDNVTEFPTYAHQIMYFAYQNRMILTDDFFTSAFYRSIQAIAQYFSQRQPSVEKDSSTKTGYKADDLLTLRDFIQSLRNAEKPKNVDKRTAQKYVYGGAPINWNIGGVASRVLPARGNGLCFFNAIVQGDGTAVANQFITALQDPNNAAVIAGILAAENPANRQAIVNHIITLIQARQFDDPDYDYVPPLFAELMGWHIQIYNTGGGFIQQFNNGGANHANLRYNGTHYDSIVPV